MTTEPREVKVDYYGKKYIPLPPLSNVHSDSVKETLSGDRLTCQHVDNQNGQAYGMIFRIYNTEETDTQTYEYELIGCAKIAIFILDSEDSLYNFFKLCELYSYRQILLVCVTNKDFELTPPTKDFIKCLGQLLGGVICLEYEHDETTENLKLKETIDAKIIIDLAQKPKPPSLCFYLRKSCTIDLMELQEDELPKDITMADFQRMGMDAYGYYDTFILHLALVGHVLPACTWWSVSSPNAGFPSNSDTLLKSETAYDADDLYGRIIHAEGDIHSLYFFEQDCNSIFKIIVLLMSQKAPIRRLIITRCTGTLSFNFLTLLPEGLEYLIVAGSQVNLASLSFPPQIVSSLKNLVLNRCDHKTEEVPSIIGKLENLEVLDVRENIFNKLAGSFSKLDKLEHLLIDTEIMVSPPPTIMRKSARDVVQYLKEIQAKPVTANREAKVIVVGQEGVGKSTFVKSLKRTGILLSNTIPPTKTDGIEISILQIKDTDCKVYDLAGDVEYLNTHPLFFSPNCLHLAVFDLSNFTVSKESRSKDQFGRLELWLQIIASQDPLSYAIIVGTHADQKLLSTEVLAKIRRSLFDILLKYRSPHQSFGTLSTYEECMICNPEKIPKEVSSSLAERPVPNVVTNTGSETTSSGIPHILGYFEVSGITNKNVKSLKRKLESSTKDIKSYTKTDTIPERWLLLRAFVLNQLLNKDQLRQQPLLPLATIEEMANHCGIFTNDSIVAMLRFFHSQGDFLWYEEIPEMKDVVIVDPQWLSDQLRTLISHLPSVNAVCEGVLKHLHLQQIWSNMSEENCTRLLTLFRSVGLCFSISHDEDMFPCKLPVGWPDREMWPPFPETNENQTSLLFEFSFVPSPFFPDLIVAINQKQASFPQEVRPLYYRFNAVYLTKQQGQCHLHAGKHKGFSQASAARSVAHDLTHSFHRVHMEMTPHSNSLKVS